MSESFAFEQLLVSVIIPVYERPELLKKTLNSIREKDQFRYEIIVIDDGSISSSQISSVVRESKHALCRYVYQKNSGAPNARNHGLSLANGKYIKFLDSDDELYPNVLEKQALELEKAHERAVCYSDWEFIGNLDDHRTGGMPMRVMGSLDEPFMNILGGWWCANFSYMFNRLSLSDVEWDESLSRGQDFDFILKVAERCPTFIYKKVKAGGYRLGDYEQITRGCTPAARRSDYRIIRGVAQRLEERDKLDDRCRSLLCERLYDIGRNFHKASEVGMETDCHFFIRSLLIDYVPLHVSMTQRYLVKLFGLAGAEKVMDVRRWLICLIQNLTKR